MPDGDYGVALMRPDGQQLLAARVGVGLVADGLFRTALLVLGCGALGLIGTTAVVRLTRRGPALASPEEAA